MNNKTVHMIAFILMAVGGLNWGLVGIGGFLGGDWNLVNMILGGMPMLETIVYVLVGLSTVYIVAGHKKDCRQCSAAGMM
jgi:uncharacterized membrane protein YuzA (DUF378 family)